MKHREVILITTHEGFKDIWVRDVKGNVVDVRMHKETLIWLWEYLDSHRVELPNKNSIDFENVEGALDSAVSQVFEKKAIGKLESFLFVWNESWILALAASGNFGMGQRYIAGNGPVGFADPFLRI